MKFRPTLVLVLLLTVFSQGCIATGIVLGSKLLFRQLSRSGKQVSMNYHTDLPTTWDAALAEARALGATRAAEQAQLGPEGGVIDATDMRVTVTALEQPDLGSRIEIAPAASGAFDVERAEAFLQAVATRLNDFSELVRDFQADFGRTWDATLAQLEQMGRRPTPAGSTVENHRGRVLVGDFWINVEQVGRAVSRVHVFLRVTASAQEIQEANQLLDGIESRVRRVK